MAPNNISWCMACSRHRSTASLGRRCARFRYPTCLTRSRASSRNRPSWTPTGYQYPGPRCRTPDRASVPTTPGRCLTSRWTSSKATHWWTRPSDRSTNSQSLFAQVLSEYRRLHPPHSADTILFTILYLMISLSLILIFLFLFFSAHAVIGSRWSQCTRK